MGHNMGRDSEQWRPRSTVATARSTSTVELASTGLKKMVTSSGKKIRIASGDFPPGIRDRLRLVQAQWFLQKRERVSIEALVGRAVEIGLGEIEHGLQAVR